MDNIGPLLMLQFNNMLMSNMNSINLKNIFENKILFFVLSCVIFYYILTFDFDI